MSKLDSTRRRFVAGAGGVGLTLATDASGIVEAAEKHAAARKGGEKEVGAVEDLMREHGIIRRAILIYHESARKLRVNRDSVDPDALRRTALLFRSFGEDYHEKKLEEAYIFPALKKAGGPAADYVDVLIDQHRRGREITDYILAVTGKGVIGSTDVDVLAKVMDGIELMYEAHAAREDTIVFPAWKDALSTKELDEMSEKFEDIERAQFGKDNFEDAVAQIGRIEQTLGLADLAQFTPPPPPPLKR